MVYITANRPKHTVKLDQIDPEDLNVDVELVQQWSKNNLDLYKLVIENGMAEYICNRQFLN